MPATVTASLDDKPIPITEKIPVSHREISKRLLHYLLSHKFRLIAGLACGVFAGAIQTSIALMVKGFIDSLLNANRNALFLVCSTVVLAYLFMGILKYGQSVLLAEVAQRVGLSLRRDIYSHLQNLSLSYFHKRRTGALLSTLTSDVPKLQNAAMMVKDVIVTPIQALMILGTMIHLSPMLILFSLTATPVMAWAIQKMSGRLRSISQETQERMAEVAAVMEETVSSPRIVRAFSAEAYEVKRFEFESERAISSQMKAVRRSARLGPTVDVIGATGVAVVLFVGGNEVLSRRMQTSDLLAFFMLVSSMANTFNSIGSLKSSWEEMMGAADRIFTEVLDVTPEIQDAPNATALVEVQGRIEFRDVDFEYVPGISVLSRINLTIQPGEVVALVGETGAGKTTLADLVPRFYDPTGGKVLVDGHDLRTVKIASLRKQIGVVPQDTMLFSGSVRDNIAYGRRDATDEQIYAAARASNALPFIEQMPEGFSTRIGERGTTLSGGQRQRIAIARALLADPRILILDEATSALDAATEALVQQALDTLMKGRTTIIIAHRLSTIVNADKIVVLKRGGCIAEMGTHSELLAKGGVYAALFETQKRSTEGTGDGEMEEHVA